MLGCGGRVECREGYPPTRRGVVEGASTSLEKKKNFSLEMAFLVHRMTKSGWEGICISAPLPLQILGVPVK